MKKALLFLPVLFVMGGLRAQNIADARRMIYCERYAGAAHLLQSLLQQDPNNAEAWWLLTRASLHNGSVEGLRNSLQHLPAGNASAPLVACAYGAIMLKENKKDSAAIFFNKALEATRQKDPQIMLAIAQAQQDIPAGDAAYAIDLLNKAIQRDKRNASLYVALGNAYRKALDGTASYKAYQEALNRDDKNAEALYRLGKIFSSQENPEMYLKYFNDAVAADPLYAPAWYDLYYHWYFKDGARAMDCLNHYIAASDSSIKNDYMLTDLLYASKKYDDAIRKAQGLIASRAGASEPRLYKLIAYSYKELNDSTAALDYMHQYFKRQNDTALVVKDFETMAEIYEKMIHQSDSAAIWYGRAESLEKDSVKKLAYAKKLSDLYHQQKDYANQAIWMAKYCQANARSTNLDIFNWGLANYMAGNFPMADSVFGIYETRYPEQEFGFYWRARSDAAIDTAMATGLAVPHYQKLIDIAGKDTANHTTRKHLIEAYGYIAAYKANTVKDYPGAIGYFQDLLTLDPGNRDAARYIEILKKNQARADAKGAAKTDQKTADNDGHSGR